MGQAGIYLPYVGVLGVGSVGQLNIDLIDLVTMSFTVLGHYGSDKHRSACCGFLWLANL